MLSGKMTGVMSNHNSSITGLAVSTEGTIGASVDLWDYSVKIWTVGAGQYVNDFETYTDAGYGKSLAISPDGHYVAVGDSRGGGRMYDAQTAGLLYAFPGKGQGIHMLAFSADGKILAFGSGQTDLTVIDTENGEIVRVFETGPFALGLVFSEDGRYLAVGTQNGAVELWEVSTGMLINTYKYDDRPILAVDFSPDGRLLAAGVRDHLLPWNSLSSTLLLWNVETGEPILLKSDFKANIAELSFSPEGRFLAVSSFDKTMRLWGVLGE